MIIIIPVVTIQSGCLGMRRCAALPRACLISAWKYAPLKLEDTPIVIQSSLNMLKPLITLQSVSLVPQFLLPFWNCRDLKHHRNVVQRSSLQPGQEQPNASPLEAPVMGGLSTKQQKGKMCVEERGHQSHWKQRWQGLEPRAIPQGSVGLY